MFDELLVEHVCPTCKSILPDYQTKALECSLAKYALGDKIDMPDVHIVEGDFEIHDYCVDCETGMHGRAYVKEGKIHKITQFDEDGIERIVAELKNKDS